MPSLLSDAYTGVPAGGFVSWPGGIGAPNVQIPLKGGKRRVRHTKKRAHRNKRTMRKRVSRK
jgi:hypothetical protein